MADDTPEQVAEVLEEAADLIFTGGWCQGRAVKRNPDGTVSHCLVGAVTKVVVKSSVGVGDRSWLALMAMLRVIGRPRSANVQHIVSFNDAKGRTVEEVLDVMHDTAKRLRDHSLALEPITGHKLTVT